MGLKTRQRGLKAYCSTWCSPKHQVGVDLAVILNKIGDPVLIRKVNNYVATYSSRLKPLETLDVCREYYVKHLHHDMIRVIKESKMPIEVETRVCNIFAAKYRSFLGYKKR